MSVTLIQGAFVIVGKQPDGDSIRFVPDDASHFDDLYRAYRMTFNQNDGSIQLRLEGIDTPETHYGPKYAQPLGDQARNELLSFLGFTGVTFDERSGQTVTGHDGDPAKGVRGAILTEGADANGRPISYVFRADAPDIAAHADGALVRPTQALLAHSANIHLLHTGAAYLTLYTSMPKSLRKYFRTTAARAREKNLGVWAVDSSAEFWLSGIEDVTPPEGALILPKLFRRAIDYCKANFDGSLLDWLKDRAGGPRPEDDGVLLESARFETTLSNILEEVNGYIRMKHDLLDIVFLEK